MIKLTSTADLPLDSTHFKMAATVTQSWKHKNDHNSLNFTDVFKFGLVADEPDPRFTLGL